MITGLTNNGNYDDDYTTFFVTLDDKFDGPSNKTNLEEKEFDSSNNDYTTDFIHKIHFKYYDTDFNNYSIYNKTNAELKKINIDMDFNDLLNSDDVKKNKVNRVINFKKLIDSKFNTNTPLISSKCSRNIKNLNKFITIFSGPNNKYILDKIVDNNLHNKI